MLLSATSSLLFQYAYECSKEGLEVIYVASREKLDKSPPMQISLQQSEGDHTIQEGVDSAVLNKVNMK